MFPEGKDSGKIVACTVNIRKPPIQAIWHNARGSLFCDRWTRQEGGGSRTYAVYAPMRCVFVEVPLKRIYLTLGLLVLGVQRLGVPRMILYFRNGDPVGLVSLEDSCQQVLDLGRKLHQHSRDVHPQRSTGMMSFYKGSAAGDAAGQGYRRCITTFFGLHLYASIWTHTSLAQTQPAMLPSGSYYGCLDMGVRACTDATLWSICKGKTLL